MIWVTYCLFLLLDATGFENGYPYNTSLCILHVAKTVTLIAVEHSFHTRVHMEWPGWVSIYVLGAKFLNKKCVCVGARAKTRVLVAFCVWCSCERYLDFLPMESTKNNVLRCFLAKLFAKCLLRSCQLHNTPAVVAIAIFKTSSFWQPQHRAIVTFLIWNKTLKFSSPIHV
jgi:hypothetical protein